MPAFEIQLAAIWRSREKCAGTTRQGNPCRMFRRQGSKFCHAHRGGMKHDRCKGCGKPSPHHSECALCRGARLKQEGHCIDCCSPRGDSRSSVRCSICLERNRTEQRKIRQKRAAAGKCRDCGRQRDRGALCRNCRERKLATYRKNRDAERRRKRDEYRRKKEAA